MTSSILQTAVRFLMPLLILFAVFLLMRGHNQPGGGFVGGLVVSASFILYSIAFGLDAARRALLVGPSTLLGIGPIPATRKVLERTGLSVADLDVIESNEAFAAQACAVMRELDFDPAKVNPNGSGISLGHPVGATGAIITVKAIHELHRTGGRYALVTMCIGGGQGIAAIFERV